MVQVTSKPSQLSRVDVVNLLREELVKRANGEVSACKLAADENIFCGGFTRFTDLELRRRYDWIARRHPRMTRAELEEVADRWQMARQEVEGSPLACDVQQKVHDTCRGWDDFTNDDLSRFYYEMTGQEIVVT